MNRSRVGVWGGVVPGGDPLCERGGVYGYLPHRIHKGKLESMEVTSKPFTILITGSRHWNDYDAIYSVLSGLNAPADSLFVHGGATGADRMGSAIAQKLGLKSICVDADWNAHGKAAGPMRNQKMIDDYKPDVCIAFP